MKKIFVIEMETEHIPWLKGFIKKQEDHIESLKKAKEKIENWNWFQRVFSPISPQKMKQDIQDLIDNNLKTLVHFYDKLQDYKEYVEKNAS
jgi:glutamate synthase domain-containing protein 3